MISAGCPLPRHRIVVPVVVQVGHDERVIGQTVVLQITGKTLERNDIGRLRSLPGAHLALTNARKVREWVVPLYIGKVVAIQIAGPGYALRVCLPGLAIRRKNAGDVVSRHLPGKFVGQIPNCLLYTSRCV